MNIQWMKPILDCNLLSLCRSEKNENCESDDVVILETKVVFAMMRLQIKRREGRGIRPEEIVKYLSKENCGNLDGDIESQVITALQSGVRKGFICSLLNGNYLLIGANAKKMIGECYSRIKHGPNCTCRLMIIGKRQCCSLKYNPRYAYVKDYGRKKPRQAKPKKMNNPGGSGDATVQNCGNQLNRSKTRKNATLYC